MAGPSDGNGRRAAEFEGEVVLSRRTESTGVVSLELGLPSGEPLASWAPGAHLELLLPNGLSRQYSLCGAIDNPTPWRIAVLWEPASRGGSQWIHDHAREGVRIGVRGPPQSLPPA